MGDGKLSKLQRFILVILLSDEAAGWTRRQFAEFVYHNYFRWKSKSTFASLSRALSRLEQRDLIARVKGKWKLTEDIFKGGTLNTPGMVFAIIELGELMKGKENFLGDFSALHWTAVQSAFENSRKKMETDNRSPEEILGSLLH
jgi:hypothetical protein